MAAYNAEMNRRVYGVALTLGGAERRADRGAFWRSIAGTLAHILWADRMWLSRFGLGAAPVLPITQSDRWDGPFEALWSERQTFDAAIEDWAATLAPEALTDTHLVQRRFGARNDPVARGLHDAGVQSPDLSPRTGARPPDSRRGRDRRDGSAFRSVQGLKRSIEFTS